jgi:hypothetical protein
VLGQTEKLMNESAAAGGGPVSVDEGEVEALVKEFASFWRAGIQQVNDDVLAYFANFRNGMDILKQVRFHCPRLLSRLYPVGAQHRFCPLVPVLSSALEF